MSRRAYKTPVRLFRRLNFLPSLLARRQLGFELFEHNFSSSHLKKGPLTPAFHGKNWFSRRSAAFLVILLLLQLPVASFGATALSKISCGATSFTGPLSKACSVYLNAAATSNTVVDLSSNNAAIWVPSTVTVVAGKSTAGFSAYIYAVQTSQAVTITGTSGTTSTKLAVTANSVSAALSISSVSLAFGNTVVKTAASRSLTLTSTGAGALTISAATISGSGFSFSGPTFPMTLASGQSATLTVSFNPALSGAAAGTLSISSSAASNSTTAVSLSGTGVPAVSSVACNNTTLVSSATSSCIATLNAAAPTGGQAVTLSSNNAAATAPSSITIPAGSSNASFTVTGSAVTSEQAVTLTASANGISKSVALEVVPAISTLGVSASSVAFGNVVLDKTATATVTLTSTGTMPVKATTETLSGSGFTVSGGTFPATLSPGQSLTITLRFAPIAAGAVTGQLVISSNSSTGSPTVVNLTGAGVNPTTSTTYYLAPQASGGNDSNSGLSASQPWLSPNHPLNCGDVIVAAASTSYNSANFNSGKWGTVTCPGANNVAWLQCAKFDSCKISSTSYGMYVDKSYWGVQGWEVTIAAPGTGFCFGAAPAYSNPKSIHHIVFANNVANGCMAGGIDLFNVGTTSVDYFVAAGNIVYNAAQGSAQCYSGISVYQPAQSDSVAGTHIYLAGNFAWDNYEPNVCGGVQAWGGDGIIFDTLDGSQGMPSAYLAQAVAENNLTIGNGGHGIEIQNNVAGTAHAPIILSNNTAWGNEANLNQQYNHLCAEVLLNSAYNVQEHNNLAATKAETACVENPEYAFSAYTVDASVSALDNFAYAYPGQASYVYNGPNYQFGPTNVVGDPDFENAYVPVAPACGGAENVPSCMTGVIANFKPTNSAAASYGYQLPSSSEVSDPLFPQWLCNVNLPAGLASNACSPAE